MINKTQHKLLLFVLFFTGIIGLEVKVLSGAVYDKTTQVDLKQQMIVINSNNKYLYPNHQAQDISAYSM
jgi:hypothetical protein